MTKTILTSDGKKKLLDELTYLNQVEKKRLLTELSDARDRGGVNDNAELDIAKEQYQKLQLKISELEKKVINSEVISSVVSSTDKVCLFANVEVLNLKTEKTTTFKLVTENEIDIKIGKISCNSPIGEGLIDKKVGDTCEIKTPGGLIQLKIVSITA